MGFLDLDGLNYFKQKLDAVFNTKVDKSSIDVSNGIASLDSSGLIPTEKLHGGESLGVATLDENGKVLSEQLPEIGTNTIEEYASLANFPVAGDSNTIYVARDTNITYRWTGTQYVSIGSNLALGTTAQSAYYGDKGNAAYVHGVTNKGSEFTAQWGKITTNSEGHVTGISSIIKSDITGLGIPAQDTTYSSLAASSGGTAVSLVTTGEKYTWNNKASTSAATTSTAGLMSASDKTKLNGIAAGAQVNPGNATTSAAGLMSASDKSKLDGIATGAQVNPGNATTSAAGLMSAADKTKLNGIATGATANAGTVTGVKINGTTKTPSSGVVDIGTVLTAHQTITKSMVTTALGFTPTSNTGTITGIKMNGATKGTSGVVDLGTVLTAHQSLSDYATKTYVSNNYVPNSGAKAIGGTNTFTAQTTFSSSVASSSTETGAVILTNGGLGVAKKIYAAQVYGAVWNDYAECRNANITDGGYCVSETNSGMMVKSWDRLLPGCRMTSDTYGFSIGETDEAKTPVAVSGRVLAYPYRDISEYHLGDALCSAPDGKVDIMTREEIKEYPERIIGTVSEIPSYDVWYGGTKKDPKPVPVNGRIWIYVR